MNEESKEIVGVDMASVGTKDRQEVRVIEVEENLPMMPQMSQVRQIDAFRMEFNQFLKEKMVKDVDFGVIPHTGTKPTLLKPGAEKLLNYFGFSQIIECLNKTENLDFEYTDKYNKNHKGYFAYTYKARILDARGRVLSEAEGSANTMETKWQTQGPFNVMNTIMKMAQKRAIVSATLAATRASEFYTVDVEDMDIKPKKEVYQPHNSSNSNTQYASDMAAMEIGDEEESGQADDVYEVKNIQEMPTKNGSTYRKLTLSDGKNYNIFDKKMVFTVGNLYHVEFTQNGNFTNITAAIPVLQDQREAAPDSDQPF